MTAAFRRPDREAGTARNGRLLTIALIVSGQSFQALASGGIALFLPLIRTDLGLTFTQAGTLAAASSLVYALMQVPSGYLSDRVDPKRLFVVGLLGTNATAALLAVVSTYHGLLGVQAASGFFRALVFAPGLMLIRAQFPSDRRATAMGLFVAGGFSSSILLNLAGPVLVGPLGWRGLFLGFGLLGVVAAVAYHRFGAGVARTWTGGSGWAAARQLLRHPVVWLTNVIQFVRLALVLGFTFWLPTYLVVERGHSLATAGLVVALGAVLTAPSNLIGGWLSDRSGRPLLVIGGSLVVLAGTLAALPLLHDLTSLIVAVAVLSVVIQLYFGPLFAVPLQYLHPSSAGLSAGFGNFWANLGGFACTYLIGSLRDATGSFAAGFWVMAGLAGIAIVATVALSRLSTRRPACRYPIS